VSWAIGDAGHECGASARTQLGAWAALPPGFEVAPDTRETRGVCGGQAWSTHAMVRDMWHGRSECCDVWCVCIRVGGRQWDGMHVAAAQGVCLTLAAQVLANGDAVWTGCGGAAASRAVIL
jgi:hypothetical protein